jgi:hypothetical protein
VTDLASRPVVAGFWSFHESVPGRRGTSSEAGFVASLLDPLTTEQKQLLAVVYEPFAQEGRWPHFQFVEMTFDQAGLDDAASVLASFPTWGPPQYGAVWYNRVLHPQKDTTVGLSVAGLFHIHGTTIPVGDKLFAGDTKGIQQLFAAALDYLVKRQGAVTPDPFVVKDVKVSSAEMRQHLQDKVVITDTTLRQLYELLRFEPSLVGSSWSGQTPDGLPIDSWTVEPRRDIRRYRGLTTVQAYLERLDAEYAIPIPPPTPVQLSPFNLLAAIDYLNAIWEARVGDGPLFRFANGLTATKLNEPCATEVEFQASLSAMSDVLKYHIGKQPSPFKRLKTLKDQLGAGSKERMESAISVLVAVNDVRVGGQHGDASGKGVAALEKLGVGYPLLDWDVAWATIQDRTVVALDIIREEVNATRKEVSDNDAD